MRTLGIIVFTRRHYCLLIYRLLIKCMLLSITEQEVELAIQDVETKGNPVNLAAFSKLKFLIETLI